jgi:hypothetical protein
MEGVYWVGLFFRLTFPDKSDYPVSHILLFYHVLDSFPWPLLTSGDVVDQ